MTEYQEGRERWWYYPGRGRSQPRSQGSLLQAERTWERSWVRSFGCFVLSASSETQGQLQSSSKILKHFPNVDCVLQWSQCFKIRVAQHWGGRGHITVRTKVWGVKISRLFRNFKRKVSVSTICDEYCIRVDSVVPTSCPWVSEDMRRHKWLAL